MGATLALKVARIWGKRLSENGFRVLTVMALTALDNDNNGNPASVYRAGHEPMAEALRDSDTKTDAALKKAVQRALEELKALGAIEATRRAYSASRAEYQLTLDREPGSFKRDTSGLAKLRVQQDTTCPPEVTCDEAFEGDTTCPPGNAIQGDTTCLPQGDTTCPAQGDTWCPPLDKEPVKEPIEEPGAHQLPLGDFAVDTSSSKQTKSGAKKTRSRHPKTLIPDDFCLTAKLRTYAAEKHFTIDIDLHTERFINYHTEKESLHSQWDRAWMNWMLAEQARANERNGARASPATESASARYTPATSVTRPPAWGAQ